jgi:hypothetical protein
VAAAVCAGAVGWWRSFMVVIPLPLLQQQQQPCWPTLARVPSHATPCCPRCKAPILQAAELVLTRVGKPYLFKALQPFRQTSEKCITVAEAYSRRDEASHVATQVRGLYSSEATISFFNGLDAASCTCRLPPHCNACFVPVHDGMMA